MNQVSTSALIAAFSRGYHATHDDPKIFDDFLAAQLFTPQEHALFSSNLAESLKFFDPEEAARRLDPKSALAGFMRAQSAPINLSRARYVEDRLEEEVAKGVRQYVILGAGLDTFAFRRPDLLRQLEVFEVDHPVTQEYKRERLRQLGWTVPPQLHFVSLDFNQGSLEGTLVATGYKPEVPGFFSWLGVTYYLPREVVFGTLRELAGLAPETSSVIFDYLESDAFVPGRAAKQVALMQEATRRAGEPMQTGLDPANLGDALAGVGLRLQENLGPAEIQARFFEGRTDGYHAYPQIHFAWAKVG